MTKKTKLLYLFPVRYSWIRQRPHCIAEGLAKFGYDVTCLSMGPVTSYRFFSRKEAWMDVWERPLLPGSFLSSIVRSLNRILIWIYLRRKKFDLVLATEPRQYCWLPPHLKKIPMVYDCMDLHPEFYTGVKRSMVLEAECQVVAAARKISVSSGNIGDYLVDKCKADRSKIYEIGNGIELDFGLKGDVPESQTGKTIAYFGTIANWIDWASIVLAAKRNAEWTFDFYGPVEGSLPASLPVNIKIKKPLSHNLAMQKMRESGILIMPFKRSPLIDGVDPVKMYEYLSTGRPIISSWWPLLEKFKSFKAVNFYRSAEELSALIGFIKSNRQYEMPREFLLKSSWNERVERFVSVLQEAQNRNHNSCER